MVLHQPRVWPVHLRRRRSPSVPAFTDRPKQSWQPGRAYSLELETAALCTKGADQGTWYGSVRWGCSVSRSGAINYAPGG